jgi:hypothetical protein
VSVWCIAALRQAPATSTAPRLPMWRSSSHASCRPGCCQGSWESSLRMRDSGPTWWPHCYGMDRSGKTCTRLLRSQVWTPSRWDTACIRACNHPLCCQVHSRQQIFICTAGSRQQAAESAEQVSCLHAVMAVDAYRLQESAG